MKKLLLILCLLLTTLSASAQKKIAQVIFCDENSTLYFTYDVPVDPENYYSETDNEWHNIGSEEYIYSGDDVTTSIGPIWSVSFIERVIFEPSFAEVRPTTCENWFSGAEYLREIIGLEYLNTSEVTNMRSMFKDCTSLESIDVSNFDIANVEDISEMFSGCRNLQTIYCDKDWALINPYMDWGDLFLNCYKLKGASNYDTSNDDLYMTNPENGYFTYTSYKSKIAQVIWIEDYSTLYFIYDKLYSAGDTYNEATITNVWSGTDVTETSKTDEPGWYGYNNKVKNVVFDASFANVRPTSCYAWFGDCYNLKEITGLEYLNTSEVTSMCLMFYESGLTNLDVSNFNTANVTDMNSMFCGCEDLTELALSNFNTANVTDMNSMFCRCYSLISLDLSNFNTAKVADMSSMFSDCNSLTSLDVSKFNTENVGIMYGMFYECSDLTSLDVSNFSTAKVNDMNSMFFDCYSLTSLDVSNFVTENVTDMAYMFGYCENLTSLDLSNFNTANVTNMTYMFEYCENLSSLDLSSFDNRAVEDMSWMFANCHNLTHINLSGFGGFGDVVPDRTDARHMFEGCSKLKSIYVGTDIGFNFYPTDDMFRNCTSLIGGNGTKADDPSDYHMTRADMPDRPGYFTSTLYLDNQAPTDGREDNATRLDANLGLTPPGGVTLSDRTLYKDGAWNTLCLPFSMTAAQIAASPLAGATITTLSKASVDGGLNGGTLVLSFSKVNSIKAGYPYLIKWGNALNIVQPQFPTSVSGAINVTKGTDFLSRGVIFTGNLDPVAFTKDDKNRLYMGADNKLYYSVTGNPLGSCRAYFILYELEIINPEEPFIPQQIVLDFGDGTTTGVRTEELNKSNADASVYDLQGRRVAQPQKGGMYIVNGKKVIY